MPSAGRASGNGWWRSWPRPARRRRTTSTAWRPRPGTSSTRCRSPTSWRPSIVDAYRVSGRDVRVAVRSSGIGEDAEGTSFAGMNETFTNVAGTEQLLTRVVDCWASLWGARSIFYRGDKELTAEPSIAVVVQEMVPSERSGVMFTVDPSTGETDHIVIEAAFGQGEVVVSGQVEPDTYVVAKDGPRLLHARVGTQYFKIVRGPDGEDQRVDLDPVEGGRRVLNDEEVVEVARIGLATEAHYGSPQDTEWAMAGGRTYLVQSRPVTAVGGAAGPGGARSWARCWCRAWRRRRAGPRESCGCCSHRTRAIACRRARSWSRP